MMRAHVETGAPLEVRTNNRIANRSLLASVLAASLALMAGCAGVVSQNSKSSVVPTSTGTTYSVSGTLSPASGGSGATVTLSGAASTTATADSSGAYIFNGLGNGVYAVTPSQVGYTFTPTSKSATVSGGNVTAVNFTANATGATHTATASWTASTSAVSGYNVYRGTISGGPYTKLNNSLIVLLNYADANVQSGQTYFFVTTAVDGSGNESVFSNEVKAVIP